MSDEVDHSLFLPRTADGVPIYPGMKVLTCCPYTSDGSVDSEVVYYVVSGNGAPSGTNDYFVYFLKRRDYTDRYGWDDGDPEHTSRVFADRAELQRFLDEHKKEIVSADAPG